jgi:hypothetical protein
MLDTRHSRNLIYLFIPFGIHECLVLNLHCKKRLLFFPSLARMSVSKLSLAGNNFIISGQGEFAW